MFGWFCHIVILLTEEETCCFYKNPYGILFVWHEHCSSLVWYDYSPEQDNACVLTMVNAFIENILKLHVQTLFRTFVSVTSWLLRPEPEPIILLECIIIIKSKSRIHSCCLVLCLTQLYPLHAYSLCIHDISHNTTRCDYLCTPRHIVLHSYRHIYEYHHNKCHLILSDPVYFITNHFHSCMNIHRFSHCHI